ncbi:MAG: murein L,D-transpeptidase catalytic domain family protein [Bdellovibrionales bacterium]|nr:murein L,D-transpeptidase catalytic domain family protein [Bdellovibrionales bacterium]
MLRLLLALSSLIIYSADTLKDPSMEKLLKNYKKQNFIAPEALDQAFHFYVNRREKEKFRKDYMAIVDFTKPSNTKRLYLLSLKEPKMESFKVSHGKGSDPDHNLVVDKMIATPRSNGTPPGFHRLAETYFGQHGLSIKMDGLEESNSTDRKRLIVMHGAKYVSWAHTGRSQGCPAVEKKHIKYLAEKLKEGGLIYHYFKPAKTKEMKSEPK